MSPFLFTLVADAFSALMRRAEDRSFTKGFSKGVDGRNIFHLQFADDILCFLDACSDQLLNLKIVLNIFECISGFGVNFSKSSIAGIGVDETRLLVVRSCWGVRLRIGL